MNLPFFIARRYFFSRKISGVIHVISLISLAGIMIGSFALIVILSAFNGFEQVVEKLYNTFESDLRISPAEGKYFELDSATVEKISLLPEVSAMTPVIEETVMLKYRNRQAFATFRAIQPEFLESTGIDTMIYLGDPLLRSGHINYALVGAGIASKIDLYGYDDLHMLQLYVPKKGRRITTLNPMSSISQKNLYASGIFSIQQEFDQQYVIIPIGFARELVGEPARVTAYDINVRSDDEIEAVQEKVGTLMGDNLQVLDRYGRDPMLYKVMRSEKLSVYLILTFILIIAAFNMIGALLMLAIEKRKDMAILTSMGAQPRTIRNIILSEGLILSFTGGIAGMLLGFLVAWLQLEYGFVKIAEGSTFVVSAYPVAFDPWDFILVFMTVLLLGFGASYYPARIAQKDTALEELRSAH